MSKGRASQHMNQFRETSKKSRNRKVSKNTATDNRRAEGQGIPTTRRFI